MIYSKTLNKEFSTQRELFHTLKENKDFLIGQKKSVIKKSFNTDSSIPISNNLISKSLNNFDNNFIYPIINSCGWLDSHDDVHLSGCYNKTVPEQQGKVWYVDSHKTSLSDIIANKSAIEMYIENVSWELLGKNYVGSTECLLFKINKNDVRKDVLNLLQKETDLQNSISMRYIKIFMAINSTDPDFKEEKELFNTYINQIVNNGRAYELGYFFGVKELAIVNEGSLCPVTGGSNSATSIILENEVVTTSQNNNTKSNNSLEELQKFRSLIKI